MGKLIQLAQKKTIHDSFGSTKNGLVSLTSQYKGISE